MKDVMTSLEQVFMLERSLRLTFQTMMAIYKSGAPSRERTSGSLCVWHVLALAVCV